MCLAALPATAFDLSDDHLNVVARTPEEAARVAAVTAPTDDFGAPETYELRPAGAGTVPARTTADAFSQPLSNMSDADRFEFHTGDAMFGKIWVPAPSSTRASDGLGPLYNARSCAACHVNDGRGHLPDGPEDNLVSFFLRVAVPGDKSAELSRIRDYIATDPDPNYGRQIQDFAVAGMAAEADVQITYEEVEMTLSDGEVVRLRKPTYKLDALAYGPLDPDARLSPRLSPQMIGLGLLEAVPAADILALADEKDVDGDGISGRPNVVWSPVLGQPMLGRFGLKAFMPTVLEQSADAFHSDIGISTTLIPAHDGDCTAAQTACTGLPNGSDRGLRDGKEVGAEGLALTVLHAQNFAPPARRNMDDPQVLRGKEVFYDSGCIACHNPKFVTHRLEDRPQHSFQLIWPYTDMLLHDMGPGLADDHPEGRATGAEWRTPPLWGIGLTKQTSLHEFYLHDGRARSLLEAILWHGGEAEAAKQRVIALPRPEREALITFLESL